MSAVLLDTDDIGAAEATLSTVFSKMRIRTPQRGAPSPMRIERSVVGSLGIDTADYGCSFAYEMDPPAQILVCQVDSGGVEQRGPHSHTTRSGPGDVTAFGPREAPRFEGRVLRGRYHVLVVDPSSLTGITGANHAVHLTGPTPVSAAANQQLANLIGYLRRCATNPQLQGNPLLAGMLEQHVAAVLLATLPNDSVVEPTAQDRRDSTPVLLRRAISFIDDHANTDISLADIAAAVYVTPRALQYLFRRHRDCTPMEYLRRVRLHHAHLDLLAADETTMVGEVARRWGFAHAGRFAAYHREHYGCSPQELLNPLPRASEVTGHPS
ncbi:AraC family transcriptional regulator [Mycobacterium aquaticum]|uniref:AraC family transcriptional regulator n=1 Tax=Mycobacterium aquaticum TaxID=1927124 RepID=A0A1X0ACN4_9MYCO|nr:AraC family transcriptional regulator [Mycobacterium aquaticum]ORA27833.1 AraC family transcriptional regulator [Mycobacterium aquaticum]